MASLISRARATALMATLGALCVSAATAADMPFASPLPPPPSNQPVEFGTGWYLRGDIGYSNMPIPVIVADFVNSLGRTGAASGGLGFGYQYNNWLRTDFEIDHAAFQLGSTQAPQWCPLGTVLDYPVGATSSSGVSVRRALRRAIFTTPTRPARPISPAVSVAPRQCSMPISIWAIGGASHPTSAPA